MHPRSFILYCVNHLTSFLPASRVFWLKVFLWRLAGILVSPKSRIISSVNIWTSSEIHIGMDTFIGHEVLIVSGDSRISIGDCVDIGPRVTIVSGSHHIDMRGTRSAGDGFSQDISIKDGVWIGASSTILGGVTIGRKSIIGAGSLVNRSIPDYVIAVGNPCRPIKRWDAVVGWVELKDDSLR
jgi:maltose O-acetyltransferase